VAREKAAGPAGRDVGGVTLYHIHPLRPTDPFFVQIQNKTAVQLKRHFETLTQQAIRLLHEVSQAGGRRRLVPKESEEQDP